MTIVSADKVVELTNRPLRSVKVAPIQSLVWQCEWCSYSIDVVADTDRDVLYEQTKAHRLVCVGDLKAANG